MYVYLCVFWGFSIRRNTISYFHNMAIKILNKKTKTKKKTNQPTNRINKGWQIIYKLLDINLQNYTGPQTCLLMAWNQISRNRKIIIRNIWQFLYFPLEYAKLLDNRHGRIERLLIARKMNDTLWVFGFSIGLCLQN